MNDSYAITMRAQDMIAQDAMAKALGFIQTRPVPLDELQRVADVVAEKEAEIDRLCDEIEKLGVPFGPGAGRRIIISVAKAHGVRLCDVLGPCREKHLVLARHHAMWLIKKHIPSMPLPRIGKLFNRDHTTVLHGIRSYQRRIDRGEV